MKAKALCVTALLAVGFTSCNSQGNSNSQEPEVDTKAQLKTENMKSYISIFEIPTTDFSRAVKFYQSILDVKIDEMDMQGTQMGLLPGDGKSAAGVIIKGDGYTPSADGVVIYLNGGDNLQNTLDKVEVNGGQIIVPKTLIDEENGYFAMFLDTEGNRLGLHSLK